MQDDEAAPDPAPEPAPSSVVEALRAGGCRLAPLAGATPAWHARVDAAQWVAAAELLRATGARLVALWAIERRGGAAAGGTANGSANESANASANEFVDESAVQAAYASGEGLVWLDLPLESPAAGYPGLEPWYPCAVRMQRAARDLSGVAPTEASDQRPWLRHASWPEGFLPLRPGGSEPPPAAAADEAYAFVRVEGEGVHEIGVGPVHAGIIEPGHFRFSVVGEKVLRLEERLGYVHRGIERLWMGRAPADGLALAQRVSGDSLVAYAWAWCQAVEALAGCEVPERASWLRAFALERERVANHLGDLGALANDAGLAFGLAQFSRLKEDWMRGTGALLGHRFARDFLVPGGVRGEPDAASLVRARADAFVMEAAVRELRSILGAHAGLQDRLVGTGRVPPLLALQLDLTGLAARASGLGADLRVDHPVPPYDTLQVQRALREEGDVAARIEVRYDELLESLRLVREIAAAAPRGPCQAPCPPAAAHARAAGRVEGWRGEILVAIETDAAGRIARAHAHDPSWQNWPALEHAVIGNIVPDFPLINKSFNLSYAGHDL